MMILGVYIPGETFTVDQLVADLPTLASAGVNTLWLTHKSAAETAAVARAAAQYGIRLVAALAELDGSVEWQRQRTAAQIRDLSEQVLTAWGDAPAPLAWGMCDEPHATYLDELRTYIADWYRVTPGAVAVLPHVGELEAMKSLGVEVLAAFNYVFRKGAA